MLIPSKEIAWLKINTKEKQSNGNYATIRYDKSYGFSLDKTFQDYSLKNAGNERYMQGFRESLERGNLQKEKFVTNTDKVEEYYVSPDIKTGSLKLYDLEKKPVPLQTQMEKGLISNEKGESLKAIYANRQNQKETQKNNQDGEGAGKKQDQKFEQKPDQKQDQKPERKQKEKQDQKQKQKMKQS